MIIIPVVIFLIYILLYLTFKSFKQALLVVGNIPFALVGGIAALWLRGMNLNLSADEVLRRLLRFNALTALTSIAGSIVMTTFLVETASMVPIVANSISVIVLGALNFVGSDRFVFRAAALALDGVERSQRRLRNERRRHWNAAPQKLC